jgi:hypothetical protein
MNKKTPRKRGKKEAQKRVFWSPAAVQNAAHDTTTDYRLQATVDAHPPSNEPKKPRKEKSTIQFDLMVTHRFLGRAPDPD